MKTSNLREFGVGVGILLGTRKKRGTSYLLIRSRNAPMRQEFDTVVSCLYYNAGANRSKPSKGIEINP